MNFCGPIFAPEGVQVVHPASNSQSSDEGHYQNELLAARCGVGIRQLMCRGQPGELSPEGARASKKGCKPRTRGSKHPPKNTTYDQCTEPVTKPLMRLITVLEEEIVGHNPYGQRPVKHFYEVVPRHCLSYFFLTMSPVFASKYTSIFCSLPFSSVSQP